MLVLDKIQAEKYKMCCGQNVRFTFTKPACPHGTLEEREHVCRKCHQTKTVYVITNEYLYNLVKQDHLNKYGNKLN